MKKLLFLSIITVLINSAELQFAVKDLALPAEFPKLTELVIKKILEQYDFESVLEFINEKCAGDESLKLAAARYWYQLNKAKITKLNLQKPKNILKSHTLLGASDGKLVVRNVENENKVLIIDINSGNILNIVDVQKFFSHRNYHSIYEDKLIVYQGGCVQIFDVNSNKFLYNFSHVEQSGCSRFNNIIAIGSGYYTNSKIILYDINTGKELHQLKIDSVESSFAISKDKIVFPSPGGAIIYDLKSGKELHTIYISDSAAVARTITIVDDKIIINLCDNRVIICDDTGKQLCSIDSGLQAYEVTISDDKIITVHKDHFSIWDASGKKLHTVKCDVPVRKAPPATTYNIDGGVAIPATVCFDIAPIPTTATSDDKFITQYGQDIMIWDLNDAIKDKDGKITFESLIEADRKLQEAADETAAEAATN
ncbi:hypothetical protein A3F66_00790 [candidate division TM6 bacterium RIFCSPHIGHO2_12_FULL_32_22]|nr:MAG: hypothetical protein A3F66_00790 [candidate division TM6 bacterium RIFCSPHIGHO2_12_FULL_32_22]